MAGWMRGLFLVLLWTSTSFGHGQDSAFIRVHFLYGSKPRSAYRESEPKWFGGKLGGHVGVEIGRDSILNFLPAGKFHVFGKKEDRHSRFAIHDHDGFYSMFGGEPDSMKRAVVTIPITPQQRITLDSLAAAYLASTPYDYAFFGMRCGAATYDVLSQVDILKAYGRSALVRKIFYPKKLRKRLFRLAEQQHWHLECHTGSSRRKWERD